MNKICTSVEQSKKLLKLGIDVNTSDMYWWSSGKRYYIEAMDDGDFNEGEGHIYAWSLSALLNLIPKVESVGYEQYPILEHDDEGYSMTSPIYNTDYYANQIDAAFEMVCWLLENKKI